MKRVNILSWPKGGETEITANKILDTFNNMQSDIKAYELDFLNLSEDKLRSCDLLIVGGSTIKDDNWLIANNTTKWGQFFNFLRLTDLSGLKAAVFSIGDQELFPDNFVDGMSVIRNALAIKGARVIGYWPTESYDFNDSRSIEGDTFMGLVIDPINQPELTDQRVHDWVYQLSSEIGL